MNISAENKTILRHGLWMFTRLKGRLSPRHYWIGLFLLVIARAPFSILFSGSRIEFQSLLLAKVIVFSVLGLALLHSWALISLLSKRCHDFGFSGWWGLLPTVLMSLIYFSPYSMHTTIFAVSGALVILTGLFPTAPGENVYGLGPVGLEEKISDKMPCDNRPKMELLEDLYHSGAITEEEYEKRRREMLGLG